MLCGFVGNTYTNGINFNGPLWGHFYTDILQGVDIPVGKKMCEKGDISKIFQEYFFVAIWQETPIYIFFHILSYIALTCFTLLLFQEYTFKVEIALLAAKKVK